MHRTRTVATAAALALAAAAVHSQAAVMTWQGGAGALNSANYVSGANSNQTPAPGDTVQIGSAGVVTHSAGALSYGRLYVGQTVTAPNGVGTLTVNNGATVALTLGAAGVANAGLMVGNGQSGTLNIDGPGSAITVNRLVNIGYGTNTSRTATLNITNGGVLNITAGNLNLGESSGTSGIQGHVFLSGDNSAINVADNTADLNIGPRAANSSFNMSGGTVSGLDVVEVGHAGGSSTGSSFNISGGSFSHTGNFFVGRGSSVNSALTIAGGSLTTTKSLYIGGGTATGNTVTHTNGTLNVAVDFKVGDANSVDTATNVYNFSGPTATSLINASTGMVIGRQANGTFNQTGGTATLGGALRIGDRETGTAATKGLYKISAGNLTVNSAGTALSIAPKGTGEFRVIGDDAVIDLNGNFLAASTVDGIGTLAFELEAGDSLSLIDVSGTATFNAGSVLLFDTTNSLPTQTTYDLLTAADIVDNGISLSAPAGWNYQIVPGGNGEILQLAMVPEPASLSLIAGAALMLNSRRRRA